MIVVVIGVVLVRRRRASADAVSTWHAVPRLDRRAGPPRRPWPSSALLSSRSRWSRPPSASSSPAAPTSPPLPGLPDPGAVVGWGPPILRGCSPTSPPSPPSAGCSRPRSSTRRARTASSRAPGDATSAARRSRPSSGRSSPSCRCSSSSPTCSASRCRRRRRPAVVSTYANEIPTTRALLFMAVLATVVCIGAITTATTGSAAAWLVVAVAASALPALAGHSAGLGRPRPRDHCRASRTSWRPSSGSAASSPSPCTPSRRDIPMERAGPALLDDRAHRDPPARRQRCRATPTRDSTLPSSAAHDRLRPGSCSPRPCSSSPSAPSAGSCASRIIGSLGDAVARCRVRPDRRPRAADHGDRRRARRRPGVEPPAARRGAAALATASACSASRTRLRPPPRTSASASTSTRCSSRSPHRGRALRRRGRAPATPRRRVAVAAHGVMAARPGGRHLVHQRRASRSTRRCPSACTCCST